MDFKKICRLGMVDIGGQVGCSLYVKIEYVGGRLSMMGVEGPLPSGNCRGACGQIDMHPWKFKAYAPGWSLSKVRKLRELWGEWHLNDMRAGTPAQRKALRDAEASGWVPSPADHYMDCCNKLRELGMFEDQGHKYGHAWIREEVPADVLDWLRSLPDADKAPAWC